MPRPTLALARSHSVLLVGLALALVYAGALFLPYGVADDYMLLGDDAGPRLRAIAGEGRVLDAALLKLVSLFADRIGELRTVRFFGVLGMTAVAGLLADAARRVGASDLAAAALGLLVCITPPFLVTASWVTSVPVILSAALALAGFRLSERSLLIAGGLVFAAAGISRVGAMIYLVPFAIQLLHGQARLVALAPLAGGYLGAELLGRSPFAPTALEGSLNTPLVEALHLHAIWPSTVVPIVVAAILAVGLLSRGEATFSRRLGQLAGATALLPLAYLPAILAGDTSGAYRTQLALTSLIVVYVFFAVQNLLPARARGAVGAVAVIAASLLAVYNLNTGITQPQMLEMRAMKSQLRRVNVTATSAVVVVGAPPGALAPVRHDEFGVPTTARSWARAPMARQILREIHRRKVPITITVEDGPVVDAFVVDMSALGSYR